MRLVLIERDSYPNTATGLSQTEQTLAQGLVDILEDARDWLIQCPTSRLSYRLQTVEQAPNKVHIHTELDQLCVHHDLATLYQFITQKPEAVVVRYRLLPDVRPAKFDLATVPVYQLSFITLDNLRSPLSNTMITWPQYLASLATGQTEPRLAIVWSRI